MRMVLESDLENLAGYTYLFVGDGEGNLLTVEDGKEKEMAKILKTSPELVKALDESLKYLAEQVADSLRQDLIDLWNKTEK